MSWYDNDDNRPGNDPVPYVGQVPGVYDPAPGLISLITTDAARRFKMIISAFGIVNKALNEPMPMATLANDNGLPWALENVGTRLMYMPDAVPDFDISAKDIPIIYPEGNFLILPLSEPDITNFDDSTNQV